LGQGIIPTTLAVFSLDGGYVAAIGVGKADRAKVPQGRRNIIKIWETSSGQAIAMIETDIPRPSTLAVSSDGRFVASTADDGIRLWDIASGKLVHQFSSAPSLASGIVFAPRGELLASAHLDGTTLLWDTAAAREKASSLLTKFDATKLPGLWDSLAADAVQAHRAVWELVAGGDEAVPFLRQKASPVPEDKMRLVENLIKELDSERFTSREKASKELELLGDLAEPSLIKSLQAKPTLEGRRRMEALLSRMTVVRSAETLRSLRLIQILEKIGSPQSIQVLQRLAGGADIARETVEARAALARLNATNGLAQNIP
jgi:hypothetical protein